MDQFIRVDGLNTRYIEAGEGPVAILLHGSSLGSSADVWGGNISVLAKRPLRVIAFDQPGFGLTDNPTDHSGNYRTQFILKFLHAIGVERAALVGHSMAGNMAVTLALSQPERISKVVIVGTGSLLPPLPDQKGRGESREGEEGGDSSPTLESTRELLENNTYNRSLITDELVQKRYQMSIGKNYAASLDRAKAPRPQRDSEPAWKKLTRLSVPFLLIYGKDDRGSAAQRSSLLAEMEPAIKIRVLDNCRHYVMWDVREEFNRLVGDFLTS